MSTKHRRTHFFIHSSSQGKYIAMSVLPALIMSLFCVYFIYGSGEQVLRSAREKPMLPVAELRHTIEYIAERGYDAEAAQRTEELRTNLTDLERSLEASQREAIYEWNRVKISIYLGLFVGLFIVGGLALIYSHRIVGPLTRFRNNIDQMAEGRQIPPVKLRKHDEFTDLAAALEKLRGKLTEDGQLE